MRIPRDVVALTATSIDAYCAVSVTGEVMAAEGTYSTSGQSDGKDARSVRVFSVKLFRLLFGIFSHPDEVSSIAKSYFDSHRSNCSTHC